MAQEKSFPPKQILTLIDSLKKQIATDRIQFIQKRLDENRHKLVGVTNDLYNLSQERGISKTDDVDSSPNLLLEGLKGAFDVRNGTVACSDKDTSSCQDDTHHSSPVPFGSSVMVKNRPIKLPEIKRLPPYTSWIFLDRNQRMADDQSVVGRRRIYYDRNGGEALICSDSEQEVVDEEDKREFVESEDYIIRMTTKEVGVSEAVMKLLGECFSCRPGEVKARYEVLHGGDVSGVRKDGVASGDLSQHFLNNDLEAALDSFDNLFCRRCLVFDCRLHGCSQDLVFPTESQHPKECREDENADCGAHCFRLALKSGLISIPDFGHKHADPESARHKSRRRAAVLSGSASRTAAPKKSKRRNSSFRRNSKRAADQVSPTTQKRQKTHESVPGDANDGGDSNPPVLLRKEAAEVRQQETTWTAIERSLCKKGVEIFGSSSCLIARNLLVGMKTCLEVYQHMNFSENFPGSTDGGGSLAEARAELSENKEVRRQSRFLRRRGRVRRLKYTWKSAGHHSIRKRISERKCEPCRQYNPCGCRSACGKQCSCLSSGTCCEKYCGCPKSCKNRFRGCHCAKSQCRSRQCPCFAADRECDPDVCRNCWVSCGDGTLGVPNQRGDNYECRNMKLFLKQQQRVLLGTSDVSGWGAFLRNNVCKHEYLGEYTGELISHREADKRGKIYDRENSSFLFNLNDQFVLDAYRKGDKLKFANHSPDPNCYAKVIMVAGDHRVGIFAKERIGAAEELFYDYRYEPERAPAWARKPETSSSTPSVGRPKKLA